MNVEQDLVFVVMGDVQTQEAHTDVNVMKAFNHLILRKNALVIIFSYFGIRFIYNIYSV